VSKAKAPRRVDAAGQAYHKSKMEAHRMHKNHPVIPWIGGKRRLAKHILPLFPEHTCYAEPFCGAAALYFFKDQSEVEVLNDINGELINLYRVIKHHLDEFVKQFRWSLTSRQIYNGSKFRHSNHHPAQA
jgi:site-specific DNA-adenine methylase